MKRSKKIVRLGIFNGIAGIILFLFPFNPCSSQCTPPVASLSLVSPAVCQGNPAYLQLSSATGQGPYSLIINGTSYSNISIGQQIGPLVNSDLSIWNSSNTPANPDSYDGQSIEVGTKFRSSVSGFITGIRFFKGVTNTGLHIASLWTSTGTRLATATFVTESANGWQEVRFNAPVAITANTTYIASYYSQGGVYALTTTYFATQGASNGPLTALQSGVDGFNGVYRYGGGFPNNSFANNNYWVDVLFTQSLSAYTTTYNLTSITDANGCTNAGALSSATLTVNPKPSGVLSPAQASFCAGSPISFNFNATSGSGPFSITTNGVTNNSVVTNQPFSSGINAAQPNITPVSIWGSTLPTNFVVDPDTRSVELGVKFRSAVSGTITGIRFYKTALNGGTHTGSIWSSNGTLLSTATFTGETATGWQTVTFSTPVAIVANQTFVASYLAPTGQYVYSQNYFTGYSATNGPITAVDGNGAFGSNGVFLYGSGGNMPGSSYRNSNYWVDVVFVPNQGYNVINMTQITDANGCTAAAQPIQALTMASGQCIPLPVTLSDLRILVKQRDIQLEWQTASENNNKGFEVQRTINNVNWEAIGFVMGAGNSTISQSYSFADRNLLPGKYYYRLKQVDNDGKFSYTKVLAAEIHGNAQNYLGQNYPNPVAQRNTTINYSLAAQSFVNITLYDLNGRVVKVLLNETKTAGQYILNSDLSILPAGTYYYKMRTTDFSDTKKLVISR